jgi:BirA family biotin operon repressor/biotin-[acetyl-CoA-carboxylase] ligase
MATSYSSRHLDEVPSTQDIARKAFAGDPVLVTAAVQTAGRGRSGSVWQTAPRAIAASLAFSPGWPITDLPTITLVAGVAATDAIEGASLKWPNDVLVGGAKVAGLLAELSEGVVVMGMGVNLWWPGPPPGVAGIHARDPGPEEGPRLAEAWATSLLRSIEAGSGNWPIDAYRRLCTTLGQDVTWEPDGSGHAVDIDASGALVVETTEGRRLLTSAAVSHVRQTDDR